MPYLRTIVLCIVGLFMTILNRVESWMTRGGTIEWFEILVIDAIWGGN